MTINDSGIISAKLKVRTRYTILNKTMRAADATQITKNTVYGLLGPKPAVCRFL